MLLGKFAWLLMAKYFCHLVPLLNVNFFKYWQKRSTCFLTLGRRREEEMGEDVIFSFGKWSSILSQSLSYSSLWSSSSEVRFSRDHCCMHRRQLLSTPPVAFWEQISKIQISSLTDKTQNLEPWPNAFSLNTLMIRNQVPIKSNNLYCVTRRR